MELGVVFPQTEIGTGRQAVREYARHAEAAGYGHLHAYDHVLGANPDRPGYDGPYDYTDPFHEPFTLFSHLAGITDTLDFISGILILPQRQTALVAKQAATVDVLSGGRLRVGVGVGWNDIEYEAMGMDFHTRGRRIEEQVDLLRRLWTEELVDFDGEFHHIPDAGLKPLPIQQPVPVLMGGGADPVLRRAGRLADGWLPPGTWKLPDADMDTLEQTIGTIRTHRNEAGKDPDEFTVWGRMNLARDDPDEWVARTRRWAEAGATHLAIDTMDMGLAFPDEHIETIERYAETVDDAGVGDLSP